MCKLNNNHFLKLFKKQIVDSVWLQLPKLPHGVSVSPEIVSLNYHIILGVIIIKGEFFIPLRTEEAAPKSLRNILLLVFEQKQHHYHWTQPLDSVGQHSNTLILGFGPHIYYHHTAI